MYLLYKVKTNYNIYFTEFIFYILAYCEKNLVRHFYFYTYLIQKKITLFKFEKKIDCPDKRSIGSLYTYTYIIKFLMNKARNTLYSIRYAAENPVLCQILRNMVLVNPIAFAVK